MSKLRNQSTIEQRHKWNRKLPEKLQTLEILHKMYEVIIYT